MFCSRVNCWFGMMRYSRSTTLQPLRCRCDLHRHLSTFVPMYIARTLEYFIPFITTYLLTPRYRVLLQKLTGLQLVKKFPAFYGTRRFITAPTSFRHPSLSWASPILSIPTTHILQIHPNIIHPSTPRSP